VYFLTLPLFCDISIHYVQRMRLNSILDYSDFLSVTHVSKDL